MGLLRYTDFMASSNPKDKPVVITAENYANKRVFKHSIVNPKILGILTVILLMVIGVGAGVYLTQAPPKTVTKANLTTADISFKPPEITVDALSSFTIDVFGNANNNQITSVKLTVKYNPAALDLLSIAPKQFLPKVLIAPDIASGSATISLGTDGNSGITGAGILASLNFRAKDFPAGSTTINFDPGQTQINLLGQSENVLGNLSPAIIRINPASKQSAQPTVSPSSNQLQNQPAGQSTNSGQTGINFDFNSDEEINSIDLSVVYSAWGTPDTDLQKKADVNGDGVVNGLDYSLFLPKMAR